MTKLFTMRSTAFLLIFATVISLLAMSVHAAKTEPSAGHSLSKRSDDAVAEAAVVQQLVSKVQALEAVLTAVQTSLAAMGRQTTLVAFDVTFQAGNVSGLQTGMTAKFDDVIMNVGDGYNPATGIFMAPVSGVYAFYLKIQTYPGHPQHLNLRDNGRDFGHIYGDDTESTDMASTLELVRLRQGEPVWVWAGTNAYFRGSGVTRFAGFLLHAE